MHRHRTAIGLVVGLGALACIAIFAVQILRQHTVSRPVEQISIVKLLPPPPPPTPPPTPPPEVEQQPKVQPMVEQKQIMVPETKPEQPRKQDEAPKPQNKAPGPIGLNAKGEGAGDSFGLVGRPGGNGLLGDGDGSGGGTRWGWYAGEVQATVEKALRDNPHTRAASLRVEVKIWPDKTGRITRVELDGSTGDPVVDAAVKNEVLNGLQLQEAPPADMPLPIVMRMTARRPN